MTKPKRSILITGSGSGLGRGMAQCLAREGHNVVVTDLNLEAARETAALIQTDGGATEAHALDVTSEESIERLLQAVGKVSVEVLVNNAGLQNVSKVEDFTSAKWDLLVDVLLKGPFLMTRAVLPGMREKGFGRVINMGSIHSLVASPFKSAYVAAKHGQLGFSKTIALETADVDITINTICPSYLYTPLVEAQIKDQARTRGISEDEVIDRVMLDPMPKKAFITYEEVAAATSFASSI